MTRKIGTRGRHTLAFDHDEALRLRGEGMTVPFIARAVGTSEHRLYQLFADIDARGAPRQSDPQYWRGQGYDWQVAVSMARMARRFAHSVPREETA